MDQEVLDRAVKIATRAALEGRPVARIVWIPPQSAASNPEGVFAVTYSQPLGAADVPPWRE